MQVDFSVELGHGDEILELPWSSADDSTHYRDLKHFPDLLLEIEEANRFPELAEFLETINSRASIFESAKCDVWVSSELHPEEEIFGATHKFGGYIDLVCSDLISRVSLSDHEKMARRLIELLQCAPEIPASVEFLIRRCYFTQGSTSGEPIEGLYFTSYIFGLGDNEELARRQWSIALKLVENAIRQISALRDDGR